MSPGTELLLSPSRNSFQELCFNPKGLRFLLILICSMSSSSLKELPKLPATTDVLLTNDKVCRPCPIGSDKYLASSTVVNFLLFCIPAYPVISSLFCIQ